MKQHWILPTFKPNKSASNNPNYNANTRTCSWCYRTQLALVIYTTTTIHHHKWVTTFQKQSGVLDHPVSASLNNLQNTSIYDRLKFIFNLLESRRNYSATSNNMKFVHSSLMGGLLHLVQRGGAWVGLQPAQSPSCTKCNSPPINDLCANHCIAVQWSVA